MRLSTPKATTTASARVGAPHRKSRTTKAVNKTTARIILFIPLGRRQGNDNSLAMSLASWVQDAWQVHGTLHASWKISSLAANGISFLGYVLNTLLSRNDRGMLFDIEQLLRHTTYCLSGGCCLNIGFYCVTFQEQVFPLTFVLLKKAHFLSQRMLESLNNTHLSPPAPLGMARLASPRSPNARQQVWPSQVSVQNHAVLFQTCSDPARSGTCSEVGSVCGDWSGDGRSS